LIHGYIYQIHILSKTCGILPMALQNLLVTHVYNPST
jgi:hypothetical protein